MKNKCENTGCNNDAGFQCPSCLQLGVKTYYCSRDCFRNSWPIHKLTHDLQRLQLDRPEVSNERPAQDYNPYPHYSYSGKLRPWPISPRRSVPDHIVKPDYAETGKPKSELARKNDTSIELMNLKDRETIRLVGKVGLLKFIIPYLPKIG